MVMVFAGGHISGAHYNPAVTLAIFIRGRIGTGDLLPYFAAQLAGGIAGALLGRLVVGGAAPTAFDPRGRDLVMAVTVELLFTFALAYVVLNVATSKDHPNNSFYGLAIGFTVLAGAVSVGDISGAVFNPAVALGITTAGMLSWIVFLLYLLATLVGGALAGYAFRALNPDDVSTPAPAAAGGTPTPDAAKRSSRQ